jgi:hypothetical protein
MAVAKEFNICDVEGISTPLEAACMTPLLATEIEGTEAKTTALLSPNKGTDTGSSTPSVIRETIEFSVTAADVGVVTTTGATAY